MKLEQDQVGQTGYLDFLGAPGVRRRLRVHMDREVTAPRGSIFLFHRVRYGDGRSRWDTDNLERQAQAVRNFMLEHADDER